MRPTVPLLLLAHALGAPISLLAQAGGVGGGAGGKGGASGGGTITVTAPVIIDDSPLDGEKDYWRDTVPRSGAQTVFGYSTLFAPRPIRVEIDSVLTDTGGDQSQRWVAVDSATCANFGIEFLSLTAVSQDANASPIVLPTRWRLPTAKSRPRCFTEYRWRFSDVAGDQTLNARAITIDTSYHPCGESPDIRKASLHAITDSLRAIADSMRARGAAYLDSAEAMTLRGQDSAQSRLATAKRHGDSSAARAALAEADAYERRSTQAKNEVARDSLLAVADSLRTKAATYLDSVDALNRSLPGTTEAQQKAAAEQRRADVTAASADSLEATAFALRSEHNAFAGCLSLAKAGPRAYKEFNAFAFALPYILVGTGFSTPFSASRGLAVIGLDFPPILQLPLVSLPFASYRAPYFFAHLRFFAGMTYPLGRDIVYGINIPQIFNTQSSNSPLQTAIGFRTGFSHERSGLLAMVYLNTTAVLSAVTGALTSFQ
jgi:hypothetical protein